MNGLLSRHRYAQVVYLAATARLVVVRAPARCRPRSGAGSRSGTLPATAGLPGALP